MRSPIPYTHHRLHLCRLYPTTINRIQIQLVIGTNVIHPLQADRKVYYQTTIDLNIRIGSYC